MDRLGATVRSELAKLGTGGDGEIAGIVGAWPAAVGETIARNAWPARVGRDGTLHVNAVSATWAFELGRMAPTILEQLRTHVGERTPPALKVVPGPVPEPVRSASTDGATHHLQVGAGDLAEAAELAAPIDDEELREAVARAAAASLARARSDRGF